MGKTNLVFSVAIFCVCCLAAITILLVRRRVLGCELGGPKAIKNASGASFAGLWILYVVVASWWAIRGEKKTGGEITVVLLLAGLAFVVSVLVPVVMMKLYKADPEEDLLLFLDSNEVTPIGKANSNPGAQLPELREAMADDTDADSTLPEST